MNSDPEPMFDNVPSKVEMFIGREYEMHKIIELLINGRVVSILGPPGIGKTSLSKNLANYLKERRAFRDGIINVRLRGCKSAQMFLTRLSFSIKAALGEANLDKIFEDESVQENIEVMKKQKSTIEDKRNDKDAVFDILRNKQVLLVLDNCEDPLEKEPDNFVDEVENILDLCPRLKILLTSRNPLNSLAHHDEKKYPLHPMSKESTVRLLFMKAARQPKAEEIKDLLECPIPEGSKVARFIHMRQSANERGQRESLSLIHHPFVTLLAGHPQAISLIGPMLKDSKLKDLFLRFCEANLMDVVHEFSDFQNSTTSLRVSLELSISRIREKKEEALNLFGLIGLLPTGVNKMEITQIWGDNTWKPLKDALVRSSLLIHKISDKEQDLYYMLPFMGERAVEILDENTKLKTHYHLKCCSIYKTYCYEVSTHYSHYFPYSFILQRKQLIILKVWPVLSVISGHVSTAHLKELIIHNLHQL